MSSTPTPGNNAGAVPDDQIRLPLPPHRPAPGYPRRRPHAITRARSYLENVVRLWPDGLTRPALDLTPCPGSESQTPAAVFGPEHEAVFIVAGVAPAGSRTTRLEAAEHLLQLRERLTSNGWDWRPTVASSPDRQWVEGGALVLGRGSSDVAALAVLHGQTTVLRWDESGLSAVGTTPDADVVPGSVPVRLSPARTGCPLRGGGAHPCQVYGGVWTSESRIAALAWSEHRELLLAAFGCDVCQGEGGTGLQSTVEFLTPSRDVGWEVERPRSDKPRRK